VNGLLVRDAQQDARGGFYDQRSFVEGLMRKKKLVSSGNSVALVIDQAFLRMMGLRRGSVVTLETDGRTLIVRPTGERICDEDANTRKRAAGHRNAGVRAEANTNAGAPIDCEAARAIGMSTTEFAELTTRAPAVFQRLWENNLPLEQYEALCHRPIPAPDPSWSPDRTWMRALGDYNRWVNSKARFNPTDAELRTMMRFEAVYAAFDGLSWESAARTALEEVPMVREPAPAVSVVETGVSEKASGRGERKDSPFMEMIWEYIGAYDPPAVRGDGLDDDDDDDDDDGRDYSVSSCRNAK
jgi:antitoxin component of MazEF toxin-antitoxin module